MRAAAALAWMALAVAPAGGAIYGQTSLVAGLGLYGGDGNTVPTATFNQPLGVASDAAANVYVADSSNHVIRRISTSGVVSTLAGDGFAGYGEGTGSAARFQQPNGVALDSSATVLYVADTQNHRIRQVGTGSGTTQLVGGDGTPGYLDGVLSGSRFNFPRGVVVSPDDATLYVSDAANNRIRMIPTNLSASSALLSGNAGSGYAEGVGAAATWFLPWGMAVTSDGSYLLVADRQNNRIRRLPTDGTSPSTLVAGNGSPGYFEGAWNVAMFSSPSYVSLSPSGSTLYVSDTGNHRIRRVNNPLATASTALVAGNGTQGYAENPGASAQFNNPAGIVIDVTDTTLLIADSLNNRLRLAPAIAGSTPTTLFAGMGMYAGDGNLAPNCTFNACEGVAEDSSGAIYVADTLNRVIRRIGTTGTVSTFSGSGAVGSNDACGTSATWNLPSGIVLSPSGADLYVADRGSHRIRQIAAGSACSALVAGNVSGYLEGTGSGANFNQPHDVAISPNGSTLYVADTMNHVLRQIALSTGTTSLLAGGPSTLGSTNGTLLAARFYQPRGVAVAPGGSTLWVADTLNHRIRALDVPGNAVTTLAGSSSGYLEGVGTAAQFTNPWRVTSDAAGATVYVGDYGNHRLRVVPASGASTTALLAGSGVAGYREGVTSGAVLQNPSALRLTASGAALLFADTLNHRIRRVEIAGFTPTVTITPTATATRTQTPSRTASRTNTFLPGTGSLTFTPCATSTDTPLTSTSSGTPTVSGTPSESATVSRTATISPTATISGTTTPSGSATSTRTETLVPTPSASATASGTSTASGSATPTFSVSATASETVTGIPGTATDSRTASATATRSASATASATHTWTATATLTSTATRTATASSTPSASATIPPSATDTGTATATTTAAVSPTPTVSGTGTATATATETSTASATGTATATASGTAAGSATATSTVNLSASATGTAAGTDTGTFTPSATATGTPTPTVSGTSTITPTPSITPTSSETQTRTWSVTHSFTPCATETPAATLTPLPGATPGTVIIFPNPVRGDAFHLYFWLDEDATVEIYVYAVTGQQKAALKDTARGPAWNDIRIPLEEPVPGAYHVKVVARFASGAPTKHFPFVKLVVARR